MYANFSSLNYLSMEIDKSAYRPSHLTQHFTSRNSPMVIEQAGGQVYQKSVVRIPHTTKKTCANPSKLQILERIQVGPTILAWLIIPALLPSNDDGSIHHLTFTQCSTGD